MKSGFRTKMRRKFNDVGNIIYGQRDKAIAARLAAPDVDEEWASRHIERCTAEIKATWSTEEASRRECYPAVPLQMCEVERLDFRTIGLRIA